MAAKKWFDSNSSIDAILAFTAGLRADYASLKFDCRLFRNFASQREPPPQLLKIQADADSWGIKVHISQGTLDANESSNTEL